jgi:hypothetical protein
MHLVLGVVGVYRNLHEVVTGSMYELHTSMLPRVLVGTFLWHHLCGFASIVSGLAAAHLDMISPASASECCVVCRCMQQVHLDKLKTRPGYVPVVSSLTVLAQGDCEQLFLRLQCILNCRLVLSASGEQTNACLRIFGNRFRGATYAAPAACCLHPRLWRVP